MITRENENGLWAPAEPAKASWEIKPYTFGVVVDKMDKDHWSFGINLSRDYEELYVCINFCRWTISIGKLSTYDLCQRKEEKSNGE